MASETKRVVRHLSVAFYVPITNPDGNKAVLVRTARYGETINPDELANGELQRLENLGAVLPEGHGVDDLAEHQAAILDLYRGQRGDQEALARSISRAGSAIKPDATGGIVNLDDPASSISSTDVASLPVGRLADHIRDGKLNADDTVALAGDDPEKARRVLEAERLASGGSPRAGVEQRLQKITEG